MVLADKLEAEYNIAESSSMALSPSKPRSAGLRAVQADARAIMASAVIQTIVRTCSR
jgi:hypothetical protein